MIKLFRYLRPFTVAIIIVFVLVFFQSMTDLYLPTLTSDIIDVGVSREGIDHIAPEAIRKTQLDRAMPLISVADQTLIKDHYDLLDAVTLDAETKDKDILKYPILATEPLYVRKAKLDDETMQVLDNAYARFFLTVQGIEKDPASVLKKMLTGESFLQSIKAMSNEEFSSMMTSMGNADLKANLKEAITQGNPIEILKSSTAANPAGTLKGMAAGNPALLPALMGQAYQTISKLPLEDQIKAFNTMIDSLQPDQQAAMLGGIINAMKPEDAAQMLTAQIDAMTDDQVTQMYKESMISAGPEKMSQMLSESIDKMDHTKQVDTLFSMIAKAPADKLQEQMQQYSDAMTKLSSVELGPVASPMVKAEYDAIGITGTQNRYIFRIGGWMLLVALFGTLCSIIASYYGSKASMGLGKILRNKVFARVESFSLREFDQFGTASLITRTTNDITQVQMFVMMMLRMMISAPIMAVGGVIMAMSKDRPLTLILAAMIPALFLLIYFIMRSALPLFKSIQLKIDQLNLVVREALTGIRVIRAFNRMDDENRKFKSANHDLTDTMIKVNKVMAFMMPTLMLLMTVGSIAVIWFGSHRVDAGSMMVGDMMAFMQYLMQIMFALIMASMMFIMLPRAIASAKRINEVLDTEPEIKDPEHPEAAPEAHGYVEFKDVTFSYPGGEAPAISNITFAAKPGQTTAIIGGTGSGKTSLINLIPRFYDVDSGSVLVDGVDVRNMTQHDLRQRIGYVPQQSILFSGSVTENIRFGKEDASEDEVIRAAQIAQAEEFITGMENGYDADISQGGTNVSGGQKQRLSIARAVARQPKVFIFDDSFSALDFKTDAKLRAALRKVTADATVLVIAQRVSTAMNSDQIIVLEEGRIAGIGNHHDLMKTCEVYREIASSQLSEEELA